MSKGFNRKFWLQSVTFEGNEEWHPWYGSYKTAQLAAARLVAESNVISFVLILDGRVEQGATVPVKMILAEFNREHREGTKLFRLPVPPSRRVFQEERLTIEEVMGRA